jgi:hypothetical protein
MLDTLITSKTRIKLLLRFFLNSKSRSYLRNLESEFKESTNSIRLELNRFEDAGLLVSSMDGNKKIYRANTGHPLFPEIHNILKKYTGIDQVVEKVAQKLGGVEKVYLTGDLAKGKESESIDIVIFGNGIDEDYLINLIGKTNKLIKREINYTIGPVQGEDKFLDENPEPLLLYQHA